MLDKKQKTGDDFWDIKAQEKAVAEHYDGQIQSCEAAINLCRRMTALKNAPGFEDMTKAIGEIEAYANSQMLAASESHELFRLQGRVNALRDVRKIMVSADARLLELDSQLQMLQNQRSAILRSDGKVDTGVDLDGIS